MQDKLCCLLVVHSCWGISCIDCWFTLLLVIWQSCYKPSVFVILFQAVMAVLSSFSGVPFQKVLRIYLEELSSFSCPSRSHFSYMHNLVLSHEALPLFFFGQGCRCSFPFLFALPLCKNLTSSLCIMTLQPIGFMQ